MCGVKQNSAKRVSWCFSVGAGVRAGHYLQLREGILHPRRVPFGRRSSRDIQEERLEGDRTGRPAAGGTLVNTTEPLLTRSYFGRSGSAALLGFLRNLRAGSSASFRDRH